MPIIEPSVTSDHLSADPLQALPLAKLCDLAPEILELLRDSITTHTDAAIDTADRLFADICRLAEHLDLDLSGIPCWRNMFGEIVGMRPATRVIHARWILDDIYTKTVGTEHQNHVENKLRWVLRGSCRTPHIASLILAEAEDAQLASLADEFADLREGLHA